MVTVGIDVHKKTHCAVAVDELGRQIGKPLTVRTTDAGNQQLLRWVAAHFPDQRVEFGVEDCRAMTVCLERALLAAGAVVRRVPPHLTAIGRTTARTRGKSDPIDALAIARAVLRHPDLPVASHDRPTRELRLLVDHREDLINTRTRLQNRLRVHLHILDPECDPAPRSLTSFATLDRLETWLEDLPPSLEARLARELIGDIRSLTVREKALQQEITGRVTPLAPALLELPGCGALTAAKLLAETANITRFRDEAAFAMHAGAAPIPASSGNTHRHRLARGGNRQLNAALHRIALTQIGRPGLGQQYYRKRLAAGDSKKEAMRALKRRLARVVFNRMHTDATALRPPATAAAA